MPGEERMPRLSASAAAATSSNAASPSRELIAKTFNEDEEAERGKGAKSKVRTLIFDLDKILIRYKILEYTLTHIL